MEEGAAGLSTGLAYPPAVGSSTDEVLALARVAAAAGGIYATHVRDEGKAAARSPKWSACKCPIKTLSR